MNLDSFKLGIPIAILGGLLAISTYTNIKGEDFSLFDQTQLARIVSLFFSGFIQSLVAFLLGLKTPEPPKKNGNGNGGSILKLEQ